MIFLRAKGSVNVRHASENRHCRLVVAAGFNPAFPADRETPPISTTSCGLTQAIVILSTPVSF